MRQSCSQRPNFQRPTDVLPQCAASCGRVRFPFLSWGWMAVLGVLASVLVYLAEGATRDPGEADRSLLGKHINGVESVAFNPGGRWLASAGGDRAAYLWDLKRGELAMVLDRAPESEETLANRVAFAPDGSTLAVANDDGSVTLWDVASGIQRHNFRASTQGVRCLAFSPDGLLLATGSTDHSIALWDVATLSRRAVLLGSSRQVNCVVFSPDGRTLASACTDGTAKLWDVSSGENIRTLNATTTKLWSVVCVAYSPDGRVLATACPESGVALWDASTGRRLETHGGCETGAMTLAFSPRGETLAWGTAGGMIELWDAGGNRRLSVWRGHSGAVVSLAFSPDGRTLASGGNDAAVGHNTHVFWRPGRHAVLTRSNPAPRMTSMSALAPIVLTFLLSAPPPPPPTPKRQSLRNSRLEAVHPAQRPEGRAASRPGRAPRDGRGGLPRRVEEREGGADRIRALLRAHDVPRHQERAELRHPLQEAGASSNAFTNQDMTVYFETVPSNFLERALYLEAERLAFLPSALDQQKFDTEREVVKNERRQSNENRPYGLDAEAILATLFPKGHPYSWSVIGSMDDLNKATLDDLKAFFAEFYHPANATLCLAGDFDPAEAKALIQKYFGALAAGPKPKAVAVPPTPVKAEKLVRFDRVQLPRVYWTWPAVADDHPDAPALDLLARVLAGGETSRLHRELVLEKRLSKDVSGNSFAWESAGRFALQSTAAKGAKPEEVLAAIESAFDAAVREIKSNPPKADELARALALFEKQSYARLTSPLSRAVTLATGFAQKDDPRYYQKEFARYYQVTPADLTRVANTYLTPEKVVVWTEAVSPGQPRSEATKAGPNPSATDTAPAIAADRAPEPGLDWSKMPGPSTARPFRHAQFVRRTLSNGIDVWFASWKTLPLVSVELLVPSGTADDPTGKSGLATLTASLLDKGTTSLTATELGESLETLGVTLTTRSSTDETAVVWNTIARNLEPSLKIVAEVLASPRFDPKDFEREQALALARLVQGPDSVTWLAGRALPVLLYGKGHPYANPADGYAETVKALTLDDVKSFHAEHIGPKGAMLIVVGDVEPDVLFADAGIDPGRVDGEEFRSLAQAPRPLEVRSERDLSRRQAGRRAVGLERRPPVG